MNNINRRYVFLDYDNLQRVNFEKLKQVCEKLYIVIHQEESHIPFSLVKEAQNFGSNLTWLTAQKAENYNLDLHLCFVMGNLHSQVDRSIEFAIISNNEEFDSVVEFINQHGRSCIRVKRKPQPGESITTMKKMVIESPKKEELMFINDIPTKQPELVKLEDTINETEKKENAFEEEFPEFNFDTNTQNAEHTNDDNERIQEATLATINRLVKSGNRPAEIELLRSYIALHERMEPSDVDKIILNMEGTNEIIISAEEVEYNF